MHPGVISAGLGSLFRPEGKSLSEEGGSSEGGGCMWEQIRVWLRYPRCLLIARWMSLLIEGLSGISRLCRVNKVCPIINPDEEVEVLMGY